MVSYVLHSVMYVKKKLETLHFHFCGWVQITGYLFHMIATTLIFASSLPDSNITEERKGSFFSSWLFYDYDDLVVSHEKNQVFWSC